MNFTNKLSIKDVDITNKRVLMRVEFNVIIVNNVIVNPSRIDASIPTIKYALENHARSVVIISHIGRPEGMVRPELSLKPVVMYLESKLGCEVIFVEDCVSDEAIRLCKDPPFGSVFLLENLRFHIEETQKIHLDAARSIPIDSDRIQAFCRRLSQLGDVFVDDAFGTSHRNHSSVNGIDLPVRASGLLLSKELTHFGMALDASRRPLLGIIGGSKITEKIQLIYALLDRVDNLILVGDMVFTFLKVVHGFHLGKSPFDKEGSVLVEKVMERAETKGVHVHLPVDFVVTSGEISDFSLTRVVSLTDQLNDKESIGDIGPETIEMYLEVIQQSNAVLLNGAPGKFPYFPFQKGTVSVLEGIEKATKDGKLTIGFGDDTEHMMRKLASPESLTLLSTGRGAVLDLLEGGLLPGVASLNDQPNLDTLLMMYMFF